MGPDPTGSDRSISVPIGGEFGTSVEMNTIRDVIDFHEKRVRCTHGYPRIVPHASVAKRESAACERAGTKFAVAFPSHDQASFIIGDLLKRTDAAENPMDATPAVKRLLETIHPTAFRGRAAASPRIAILEIDGLTVACLDDEKLADRLRHLRRVWGSAFDVHALAGKPVTEPDGFSHEVLLGAIARLEGERGVGSLDFQSGMAAIASIVLGMLSIGRRLILIGPAYVDTDVMISHWPGEVKGIVSKWLPEDVSADTLASELEKGPALVFFETPTNPRLTIPDMPKILDLAKKHNALVCIDATIATPYNFRPLDHGFDIVMHSTSKFLSGRFEHLGGVVTASSREILEEIRTARDSLDLGMCVNQMRVLHGNLSGFGTRMATINSSARRIVERLIRSPAIGPVMYPGLASDRQEELCRTYFDPGRSGLLSFVLRDQSLEGLAKFHDAVLPPIKKGPGLGGETSLMCPYVMVAHYKADPAFLKSRGLHPHLVRLSVGTEPVEDIWNAMGLPS